MSSAYIALGYACNQKCSFCPCTKEDKKLGEISIEKIYSIIDDLIENNITDVVISGGEPTIHSTFFETISYALEKDMLICVLSNSERFSEKVFLDDFSKVVKGKEDKITLITTLHSQDYKEHEKINGVEGSFERSISGLKNINHMGIHVVVKHCITKLNYKNLKDFYLFVNTTFSKKVAIQFCSIDYCGIENNKEAHKVAFPQLRPYFEEMFDVHIEMQEPRYVYCINMPLCSVDPYYWRFFAGKSQGYQGYASPQKSEQVNYASEMEVGTFSDACKQCRAEKYCAGTYKSAYQYYGNSIFKPYK